MDSRQAISSQEAWLVILGALMVAMPLGIDLILPSLPAIAESFAAPTSSIQLTLTAYLVGLALGQLVAGPVSDVVGRRVPILAGLVLVTVGTIAGALAPTLEWLVAARAVNGLGAGTLFVVAGGVIRDQHSGTDTARALSRVTVIVSGSAVVGPILGASLLQLFGWRGVLGTMAAMGALLLLVTWRWLPETMTRMQHMGSWHRRLLSDAAGLMRDSDFVGYGLTVVLSTAALWAVLGASSFLLQQTYGITAQAYGLVLTISGLCLLVLTQVTAVSVRRVGPARLTGVGVVVLLAGAACLMIGAAQSSLRLLVLGLVLIMACLGLIVPCARALSVQHHADRAGSAFAIIGTTQFALGALVVPLTGWLPWGVQMSSAVTAGVLALGALAGVGVARFGSTRS